MKKIFVSVFALMMLLVGVVTSTGAFADTVYPSPMPPSAVGTYNDFGNQIRLDINPNGTNAVQFKVYYAPGYNATSGFQSYYSTAIPNIYINSIWYARTEFQVPTQGFWTIMVTSVGADGRTSKPFTTNVDVLR